LFNNLKFMKKTFPLFDLKEKVKIIQ
jgi:hypothetical protein